MVGGHDLWVGTVSMRRSTVYGKRGAARPLHCGPCHGGAGGGGRTYDVGVEEGTLDAEEGPAERCPVGVGFGRLRLEGEELVSPEPMGDLARLENRRSPGCAKANQRADGGEALSVCVVRGMAGSRKG